jgi:hypothetical protein
MAPREYLGAWGTLIHEKNLKSKISCQTPFKPLKTVLCSFQDGVPVNYTTNKGEMQL